MTHLITTYSCRYGVGKSTLNSNVAVCLAQLGHRVGILDLDSQSPGIHTLFGLDNEHTDRQINALLSANSTVDPTAPVSTPFLAYGTGAVVVMSGGVNLPGYPIQLHQMSQKLRSGVDPCILSQSLLELLDRLQLDYCLIDAHPGLSEATLFSITSSDLLILVANPDQQDFQELAVTLDIARHLGVPKIFLIANQVCDRFDTDSLKRELEKVYPETVAAILPFCNEVLQLASQSIFCLRYPHHPLTALLESIAQQILTLPSHSTECSQRTLDRESLSAPPLASAAEQPGFSITEMLTLPDEQRRLMRWIMQHRSATLADLTAQDDRLSTTELQSLLHALMEQGYVQETVSEGETYYHVRFAPKRKQTPLSQLL